MHKIKSFSVLEILTIQRSILILTTTSYRIFASETHYFIYSQLSQFAAFVKNITFHFGTMPLY